MLRSAVSLTVGLQTHVCGVFGLLRVRSARAGTDPQHVWTLYQSKNEWVGCSYTVCVMCGTDQARLGGTRPHSDRLVSILPAGSDQLDRDCMRLPPRPRMVRPVFMRLVSQSSVGRHAVAFSLRARGVDFSTVCFRECWTPPLPTTRGPNGQFSNTTVDHQYGAIRVPEVLA